MTETLDTCEAPLYLKNKMKRLHQLKYYSDQTDHLHHVIKGPSKSHVITKLEVRRNQAVHCNS